MNKIIIFLCFVNSLCWSQNNVKNNSEHHFFTVGGIGSGEGYLNSAVSINYGYKYHLFSIKKWGGVEQTEEWNNKFSEWCISYGRFRYSRWVRIAGSLGISCAKGDWEDGNNGQYHKYKNELGVHIEASTCFTPLEFLGFGFQLGVTLRKNKQSTIMLFLALGK